MVFQVPLHLPQFTTIYSIHHNNIFGHIIYENTNYDADFFVKFVRKCS